MARRRTPTLVWLRRATQLGFTLAFLVLFLETVYHPINRTGGRVTLFFDLDPLMPLTVWAASGVVAGSLLALATVALAVLLGRSFCGWLCPFGAIHAAASTLRPGRAKQRRIGGGYTQAQRLKYLVLLAVLAAAAFGWNAVGWVDPFSILYRSLATAVYPAASTLARDVFAWIYDRDPGIGGLRLTAVSEPVYEQLRRFVLPLEPPHFAGAVLIGGLFLGLVALNLARARFWCRVVCPLGALLGLLGRRSLVRVQCDAERCNSCGLCRAACQGGAEPDTGWRVSECVLCLNCEAVCPSRALRIGFVQRAARPKVALAVEEASQ